MKKLSVFIFLIFISSGAAYPQLKQLGGKLLKKAGEAVQKQAVETAKSEADKKEARVDSTKFNYAIMLSDNSALFETRDFFQRNNQILSNLLTDSETSERTPDEEGEEWLNLGENFYTGNRYRSAEHALITAQMIFESGKATQSLDYFRTLEDLGLLYHVTGRFNQSEYYTREAMDKREATLGRNTGAYAASLNNLAALYKDLGKYNEAEKMFNEAADINASDLGPESLGEAIILNNKAMLFNSIGRYEEAERILNESLAIAKKSLGENTSRYQKLMINKALLLQDLGRNEEAEIIYKDAIQLKERRLGRNHPDYAQMLMGLAALYVQMDRPEEVKDLLLDAAEIYKAKFGDQSLPYASAISNLASFYQFQGKYTDAAPLLENALKVRSESLGEDNPLLAESEESMAINYWKAGDLEKAKQYYSSVLGKTLGFIDTYFPPMSEAEKTRYWDVLQPRFQRFYSFVGDNFEKDPGLLEQAFAVRLSTKALLLNATSKVRLLILGSNDKALIDDYLKWLDQKEMLSRYYALSKEEIAEDKINLDSMERAANSLERSLSERSSAFTSGYSRNQVTVANAAAQLEAGEALVEIIQYQHFDNKFTPDSYYMALTIDRDHPSSPKGVLLKNGNELEARYFNYYKNSIRLKSKDEFSFKMFWEPVERTASDKNVIYVSPDGIYNQVNINTFIKPDGSYIIDSRNIIILGSSRDILEVKKTMKQGTVESSGSTAFLLGYPVYGDDKKLAPLPGTKTEVENINKILGAGKFRTSMFMQDQALEQNVKKIDNPRLMHIATHGFFLRDVDKLSGEKVFGVRSDKAKDNPLLRSGLFLSGSASSMDGRNTSELNNEDDGILTAYEAMNLNIDRTDIVVLSACETGLGDVKSGEGVYGLQRAFFVAGSGAVVMSLWKVNDEATQLLMTRFYSEWVKTGNKLAAFRTAQLSLKQSMKDPYFWGAFVMIGA
ncbi:MAG TPA: CHAT domain-containing tetratricopeptide repeat protein [Cyclobacteriaceae bacterium]|nr:CHAT domain-containing tetratricopeptide repeat protein [Cyclobacteriaceae bacterium]